MKNILAENMLRFGTKNLSESSIQRLNEQDTGAYDQQSLLAITAAEIQPAIDILNATIKQVANQFKVKYYPIGLGRDETTESGTDFIGPRSNWYLTVNGKRIPAIQTDYVSYNSPMQTLDYNDQYQGGDDIGLINGSDKLQGWFSNEDKYRTFNKVKELIIGNKHRSKTYGGTGFVGLLNAPLSALAPKPAFVDQNGKSRLIELGRALKPLFVDGGPIQKSISSAINKKWNKFAALNKKMIAGTGEGQIDYGQTSQTAESKNLNEQEPGTGISDADSMATWANKWVEITNQFIAKAEQRNPGKKYPRASVTEKGTGSDISYELNVPGFGTKVPYKFTSVPRRIDLTPQEYTKKIKELTNMFLQYAKLDDKNALNRANSYNELADMVKRAFRRWQNAWVAHTSQTPG
jgi:hypothetical protein